MSVVKKTRPVIVNENPDDPNVRDPEHAHELGGTLGMTVGGVAGGIAAGAAAGAAIGGIAGPIGAVAGAAIGGALGGSAGESIARDVNPTAEEAYWEETYMERPYVIEDSGYENYRPAYRHGINAYTKYADRSFNDVEPEMSKTWAGARGNSTLEWNDARAASRDAFDRLKTTPTTVSKK